MSEKEDDSFSVESGSCDCSNYNSDISWFYDSKKLQTSSMNFSILITKNITKIESIKEPSEIEKNEENKQDEIKVNLNKEPQKITMPKFIRNINKSFDNIQNLNITRKSTGYRSKYKMALRNNKSYDLNLNIEKNKKETNQNDIEYNSDNEKENNKDEENETKPKINNKHSTFRFNLRKKFNINNDNNGEKEIENREVIKDKDKDVNQITPRYTGFRRRFFNVHNDLVKSKDKEEKEDNEEKKEKDNINKNNKEQIDENNHKKEINGKILKEKVVNETKTITLEPGQTIKPKIVKQRKLKPKTYIETNDDGSQNIITENTILVTTIINELKDPSKECNDNYPLDIQLVEQHITKTYKIEIESNPYIP